VVRAECRIWFGLLALLQSGLLLSDFWDFWDFGVLNAAISDGKFHGFFNQQ
jgi:hypothetical protein